MTTANGVWAQMRRRNVVRLQDTRNVPGRLTDSAAGSYAWLEIGLRSDRAQEMIGRQMRDERIEFSDALFYSRSCLGCKERKEHELTT